MVHRGPQSVLCNIGQPCMMAYAVNPGCLSRCCRIHSPPVHCRWQEKSFPSVLITQVTSYSKVKSLSRQDIFHKDRLQAAKINLFLLFILLLLLSCCSVVRIYYAQKIFGCCFFLGKDGLMLQSVC